MRTSDFDPYTWDYRKLKGSSDADMLMRLRCGLLLNGIDLASNGGMTTAAHTEKDVTETVSAFAQTLEWLKVESEKSR
jgi:glutamate-1-semialdehyde 2,1-aminomutase